MSATPDDRYVPRERSKILRLEEGQRLETDFVTVIAMRSKDSVEIECECTAATPDTPDCDMTIDPLPGGGGMRATCVAVRGCHECATRIRLPTRGVMLESPSTRWPGGRMLLL